MDVMIYLVPLAIILGALWLGAFVWTLKSHQYDDMQGAAERILLDDLPLDAEPASQPAGSKPESQP